MTKDGAESQLLKTLDRLPPERYEVSVVLSRAEGERLKELAALPCVREVATLAGQDRRMRLLEKAFALGGIVNATKPDIVHSWLWYSNFLCGLSRKFGLWRQIPFIASQRGDYQARYGKFRRYLTEKLIYNAADVLLTNSAQIQRHLHQRYPDINIFSIPNLLELPTETWSSPRTDRPEEQLVVSVGRFAPEKGHRYLIEALNVLDREDVAWRCTFLGEGELETELRTLTAEYDLSEWVAFPGFCENVFSVLLTADVFVLPSLHESSPNALIEAMGIGMPCIASDVGGIVELIEDGQNGIRVPPQDPAALATALHRVLTDPDFASELGRNARTTIQQRFDSAASVRKLGKDLSAIARRQLIPDIGRHRVTEWHRAYIQNAYRELENGTTQRQLDTLRIDATGKRVLDVGCGPGNLLVALSTDTPELLVGVDVDAFFLTSGRSRIGKLIEPLSADPVLLRASLPILPFADESFDLVTCFLVMPHVPDDKTALIELARVLKPGGTLAISGHGWGFPLRYLKRFKLKPLQMYLASLVYRCTGNKWIRNTLQNDKKICDILRHIGVVPEMWYYNKRVLGCVATYWIKAIKSEVNPKATQ